MPVDWLRYQHHLTRALLPKVRVIALEDLIAPSRFLLAEHTRTVTIVSVDGIKEFLSALRDEALFFTRI